MSLPLPQHTHTHTHTHTQGGVTGGSSVEHPSIAQEMTPPPPIYCAANLAQQNELVSPPNLKGGAIQNTAFKSSAFTAKFKGIITEFFLSTMVTVYTEKGLELST